MRFSDRSSAGRQLARKLKIYRQTASIILALPRGGVVVGFEVAKMLDLPLEVIIARKLGAPLNKEFGVGAISENETIIFDQDSLQKLELAVEDLVEVVSQERAELQRRINLYRHGQPLPSLKNQNAILVDDGLATGVTAKAAIQAIRKLKPNKLILAVPVGPASLVKEISLMVDELICLKTPADFEAVGSWYKNFDQVTDEQVLELLTKLPRKHF